MEPRRDEHWIADVEMYPGEHSTRRIVWIYFVKDDGDIGFCLIGDDGVYWVSQVERFNLIRRIEMGD